MIVDNVFPDEEFSIAICCSHFIIGLDKLEGVFDAAPL
jgi:hypothetical protein